MANLKVLENRDGYDYIWSFSNAVRILDIHCKSSGITKVSFYDTISQELSLTSGAIKNWFTRKNGPNELDDVKAMAQHFCVDYKDLLQSIEKERDDLTNDLIAEVLNMRCNELDHETIRFISMLNDLAEKSKRGYCAFRDYKREDDNSKVIYIDDDMDHGEIVMDMCVDDNHHDVVSTLNSYAWEQEFDARVRTDEDELFIEIMLNDGDCIVIEDGRWYFC